MEAIAILVVVLGIILAALIERWMGWLPAPSDEDMESRTAFLEAMLERERLDPIPRSDVEKVLRRQMPVEAEGLNLSAR